MVSTGVAINNVFYIIVQILMAFSIIGFTAYSLLHNRKSSKQSLCYIVIPNVLFNLVSLYCVSVILICPITALMDPDKVDATTLRLFPCNSLCKDYLPFVQTITFIVVLFLRCIDIFKDSNAYKIGVRTKIIFCIVLVSSISLWISLLATNWTLPHSAPWVSCIMTLCMINLWFALWMEVLIISKLVRVISSHVQEHHRRTAQGIRHLITKSALLATIAMGTTIVACFFFLIRIHSFGNHVGVHIMSEWLISFDIYLNFLANLLTHASYNKLYGRLCQPLHTKCDMCFQKLIFGSTFNADASQMLNMELRNQQSAQSTRKHSELPELTVTVTSTGSDVVPTAPQKSELAEQPVVLSTTLSKTGQI